MSCASTRSRSGPTACNAIWLKKNGYDGSGADCPGCGRSARFHGHRPVRLMTLHGEVDWNRGYYYRGRCRKGQCPADRDAGLDGRRLSASVRQVAALAGIHSPSFEKAAEMIKVMSDVTLGESTVERTTEEAGREPDQACRSGWTPSIPAAWKWPLDALDRRMACVQIDATGVGIQGPGGTEAPGRMVWVGAVTNAAVQTAPSPGEPPFRLRTRYVAGLCPLAEMGPLLRRQAASVGLEHVEDWIALSDGGQGLEEFLRVNFPRVEAIIIDYWHVSEYLAKLAEAACPSDEAAREALRREWGRLLKEEGGWTTLNVVREYEPPSRTKLWKAT